tara:strand:+ start:85 stop:453 length:369 start_codon:yes stop_codon:yes gene_type:complete
MNWQDVLKGPAQDRDNAMRKVKGKIDYLLNLNLKRNVEPSKEEADKLEAFLEKELDDFLPNADVEVTFFIRDGKYIVSFVVKGMGEPMFSSYTHQLFGKKKKKKDDSILFESDNALNRRDDY